LRSLEANSDSPERKKNTSVVIEVDTLPDKLWHLRENESLDRTRFPICPDLVVTEETLCAMDIVYTILLTPVLDSELRLLHVSKCLEVRRGLVSLLDGELELPHLLECLAACLYDHLGQSKRCHFIHRHSQQGYRSDPLREYAGE
jgi:hypothetical protein